MLSGRCGYGYAALLSAVGRMAHNSVDSDSIDTCTSLFQNPSGRARHAETSLPPTDNRRCTQFRRATRDTGGAVSWYLEDDSSSYG
jgi:hypothetical protein